MTPAALDGGGARRVVAGLACRLNGTRLYAKPLQALAPGVSILEHIVASVRSDPQVDDVVLAIADEPENRWLAGLAERLGCGAVFGDPHDVLRRLIDAGEAVGATDLLRKTTESPFFEFDGLGRALRLHIEDANDVTVLDHVPLGAGVEVYTMDALRRSHSEGRPEDRSELVSNYARFNQARFRIGIVEPVAGCRRTDLRLTVDNPEDLIVCRAVYQQFAQDAPRIPLEAVVQWLDRQPGLTGLVSQWVYDQPLWDGAVQR